MLSAFCWAFMWAALVNGGFLEVHNFTGTALRVSIYIFFVTIGIAMGPVFFCRTLWDIEYDAKEIIVNRYFGLYRCVYTYNQVSSVCFRGGSKRFECMVICFSDKMRLSIYELSSGYKQFVATLNELVDDKICH